MLRRWRDESGRWGERPRDARLEHAPPDRSRRSSVEPDDETGMLGVALSEMEATALAIYAAHGLPTVGGEYAWTPGLDDWRYLGASLSPQERWTILQSDIVGQRYGTLSDLGRHTTAAAIVRLAGEVLGAVAELRSGFRGSGNVDPIVTALRLGADWQALRQEEAWRTPSDLKLSVPDIGVSSPD